ncbi:MULTISPECIES: TonB-dependent receptor [unclassified Oceanobacter]|uniref:TonB-dependent receptor n=2 Tax=Gammaproteobacteria TaxID=1236 RepID=UPI002733781C|nr:MULTISPECIES: TonB-dependent receptor [unclassified Oceanobacter]MDP2608419.1 TonB-dependent receptor [Oceanobacter sp. 1_MG-2023]MDP2611514.1 TonB-dependent receptor [Oceanobacter sp. 2_MG-2023]
MLFRNFRPRVGCHALLLSAAMGLGVAAPAAVAQDASTNLSQFSIPAGDLGTAITRFAAQSGVSLSVSSSMLANRQTQGLEGNYSIGQALKLLLEGTGLTASKQANGSYLLTDTPVAAAALNAGDPLMLQTMVVSAAGFEQKLTDAPASISVVDQKELNSRPYTTLLDVVRELEGVDIGETRDKTGQGTISMRGMGSDYTLILVDGRRQNNHGDIYPNSFGGNQFNHIPPLTAIERVEVIRGPASTLYGADALGGVINVITKKVTDEWTGGINFSRTLQENDDFGDDTTIDFNVMGPLIKDKLGVAVRGSLYDREASNPEYDSVIDPYGDTQTRSLGFGGGGKTVDNTNKSLGFRLSWTPDARQTVVFDIDTSEQVYDNSMNSDGSYPLGTVDSIDRLWSSSPRAGYKEEQSFTRDQWSLAHEGDWDFGHSNVSLAYIETANKGRTLPLTATERALQTEIYEGTGDYAGLSEEERMEIMEDEFLPRPDRVMTSSQYTLDAKLDLPIEDLAGEHLLVVGLQYIDGELEDGVFGMEDGDEGSGAVSDHEMYSLFVEDNWTPITPLTITAGIRYDDHSQFGSNTSPRLYGVYDVQPGWTVKGGVSTGYKTPKTTDLYDGITGFGGQGTSPFVGNPDLEPETSVNTEVALYWESLVKRDNANITVFHNKFENKIVSGDTVYSCAQTGGVKPCANLGAYEDIGYDSYSQKINIDEAEIKGAELAGRYQILDDLAFRMNYTYTDSEQTSGSEKGQPLTDTAKHMANATLEWQVDERTNLFLTMEKRSDRFRGVDEYDRHLYYKSYQVLHLGGSIALNESVTIHGRINNLLDEDFTSYTTAFEDNNNDGVYDSDDDEVIYTDDYNNKDKARNFWAGVSITF